MYQVFEFKKAVITQSLQSHKENRQRAGSSPSPSGSDFFVSSLKSAYYWLCLCENPPYRSVLV